MDSAEDASPANRVIVGALVIAERTAELHVSNILGKRGVASRTQAAAYVLAQGLAADPTHDHLPSHDTPSFETNSGLVLLLCTSSSGRFTRDLQG